MSMFMFSGSRDFAFELDGVSYFYDDGGYGREDSLSYDGITKSEFMRAKMKYELLKIFRKHKKETSK